jgi:hypothetical protein
MSEVPPSVQNILATLRRRQRAINAMRWSVHGLLIGAVAGCAGATVAWAAAHRVRWCSVPWRSPARC